MTTPAPPVPSADPLDYTCPACSSKPRAKCTQPTNTSRSAVSWLHLSRIDAPAHALDKWREAIKEWRALDQYGGCDTCRVAGRWLCPEHETAGGGPCVS